MEQYKIMLKNKPKNKVIKATYLKVPLLKDAGEAKNTLLEISQSMQATVINLTGSLPAAPIVQSRVQISAMTDVAMTDWLPKPKKQGYVYH